MPFICCKDGQCQAVLKPLRRFYKHQDHIWGTTIPIDGTLAPGMDTNKMIKQFIKAENLTV